MSITNIIFYTLTFNFLFSIFKIIIIVLIFEGELMSENLVGQEIEAYCGKCKDNTIHLITTLSGEKIEKVMCKVCKRYHKYKVPTYVSSETPVKKTKIKPIPVKTTRPRRNKWTRILDNSDHDSAVEYKMDKSYEVETTILHKNFGLGVVKTVIDTRKIEVLFNDGEKLLVQNYNF